MIHLMIRLMIVLYLGFFSLCWLRLIYPQVFQSIVPFMPGDNTSFAVELIAPICKWTSGKWDSIDVPWNEIQNTPKDIKKLQEMLVRAYTAKILK